MRDREGDEGAVERIEEEVEERENERREKGECRKTEEDEE